MGDESLIAPSEARVLSPRIITVWRIALLIWTFAILGAVVAAGWLLGQRIAGAAGATSVLAIGLALTAAWPPARYRSWSFALGDADVVVRRGVWWRVTSIIPHARVQHVDTIQGPLERKLGLSSVVIYTAGTIDASVAIPGLRADEAEQLRDTLATLARVGEAV